MLGYAESENLMLITHEIIFEVGLTTIPQRYRRTDRRTDGRKDNLPWQYRALLCVASRGDRTQPQTIQ